MSQEGKRHSRLSPSPTSIRSLSSDLAHLDNDESYSLHRHGSTRAISATKFGSANQLTFATTLLRTRRSALLLSPNPETTGEIRLPSRLETLNKQMTVTELLELAAKVVNNLYEGAANRSGHGRGELLQGRFHGNFREAVCCCLRNPEFKKKHNKNTLEYLNMVYYSSHSLRNKTYSEIETAVLIQWRRNPVLYFIRSKWFHMLQQILHEFGTESFHFLQHVLEDFKNLVAHLAFVSFRAYFSHLERDPLKGADWIIEKLHTQAAPSLITECSSWLKLYQHAILPSLLKSTPPFFINKKQHRLGLGGKLQCLEQHLSSLAQPFFETCSAVKKMLETREIGRKLMRLAKIRACLEEEILQHQRFLIQAGELVRLITLDKDEIISCLIFCIMRSREPNLLYELHLGLLEVTMVLGASMNCILARVKCSSYFADLEAAIHFIQQQYGSTDESESPT